MVTFSLGAGAEVDVLSTQEYMEDQSKLRSWLKNAATADPSLRKVSSQSVVLDANGKGVLDLGGPPGGTLWAPLFLTLCGADDRTPVAGAQVALYAGGEAQSNPPLSQLLIPAPFLTVPSFTQISGRQDFYIHFGDHIFCLIYGGTVGATVTATLRYREVHPARREELNML